MEWKNLWYVILFPFISLVWRLRGLCGLCGEDTDACYCADDADKGTVDE